jgi:SpoVK/Ycf46/Vps4 family AAA+-type ATPase
MTEASFANQISLFNTAGFSCLMVVTREEQVAETEIHKGLNKNEKAPKVLRFSVASALQELMPNGKIKVSDAGLTDPMDLMAKLPSVLGLQDSDKKTVLLLPDFAEFLKRDSILRRCFRERIWWARGVGHQIILIAETKMELPDLMNDITVINHGLPDRETTAKTLNDLATEYKAALTPEEQEVCLEALAGMTSVAQGDAISLALVHHVTNVKTKPIKIDPKILQENKEREISRRGYLNIVKPTVSFANVVGHDALKDWSRLRRRGFTRAAREFGVLPPKGMLLAGPPGTGKTLFAKAICNEWGLPLLQLRFSALFTSMLGESEANVRDAIEVAKRMAPCILWADEINRAFGGGSGERDGGTQERITGEFLTWLSEKTEEVFVLATANDVTGMPAEMLRKGRWDEIWAVSTPSPEERAGIFELYLKNKPNTVTVPLMVEASDLWIPAEIEAAVNSAHLAKSRVRRHWLFPLRKSLMR